jgi:hypothetical protein
MENERRSEEEMVRYGSEMGVGVCLPFYLKKASQGAPSSLRTNITCFSSEP